VLYNLLYPLSEYYTIFNVLNILLLEQYMRLLLALYSVSVLIPALTKVLKHHQLSQKVRVMSPKDTKKGRYSNNGWGGNTAFCCTVNPVVGGFKEPLYLDYYLCHGGNWDYRIL